jgi:hypothetical protein
VFGQDSLKFTTLILDKEVHFEKVLSFLSKLLSLVKRIEFLKIVVLPLQNPHPSNYIVCDKSKFSFR